MEIVIGILAIPLSLGLVWYVYKISYAKGFEDGYRAADSESITFMIPKD